MSINLGLSRVKKLLECVGNPQQNLRVLHVAGTNGKGSVCSYLASTLMQQQQQQSQENYRVGKFTSPHLVHITDSIAVNNVPMPRTACEQIRAELEALNTARRFHCTEFELLTCTALKYFHDVRCQWCVLEVGLGGRLDATNVVPGASKLCCGIAKVGLDHEALLGSTLGAVAAEKAGIVVAGVPLVVVDGSNDRTVLDAVRRQCQLAQCRMQVTSTKDACTVDTCSWGPLVFDRLPLSGAYQIHNLRVALGMLDHLQQHGYISLSKDMLYSGITSVQWPGRLQRLDLCIRSAQKGQATTVPVLLDGAHNASAAVELATYLRKQYGDQPLTFVMALTKGKTVAPLLQALVRPVDRVVVTRFGPVQGMPWIAPMDPAELAGLLREQRHCRVEVLPGLHGIAEKLRSLHAEALVPGRPIVICGSLYLCGQLLALHNENLAKS